MTTHCVNKLRQKKMHLSYLIPYTEKHLILAINIVIAQITILITCWGLCNEISKIWRIVIGENIMLVA